MRPSLWKGQELLIYSIQSLLQLEGGYSRVLEGLSRRKFWRSSRAWKPLLWRECWASPVRPWSFSQMSISCAFLEGVGTGIAWEDQETPPNWVCVFPIVLAIASPVCKLFVYVYLFPSTEAASINVLFQHWERLWCWEWVRAGGEEGDRGWDGWMASSPQWIWVWANSRR